MGGIGKTVLATALARDDDIREAFTDGIFWITLGQTPKLLDWQLYLSEALADKQATFTEISLGKAKLKELFADKSCLLILDDIWNLNHATAFDVLGEKSQMLVTTRDTSIITSLGAVAQELGVLSHEQSLQLLGEWAGYEDNNPLPPEANQIVEECGNLPLALSMVGAMLQGKP
ncbi:MAG: NB-ARC domain-containing protein, partial [Cyanobacteria bacterium J06641_2]